jgi:hypothetical protein
MTSEDLEGIDSKVRAGLSGVLEGLNVTLGDVVSILTKGAGGDNLNEELKAVKLVVDDTLASAFPLQFKTTVKAPRMVLLVNCQPEDPNHSLATPFVVQGYGFTDAGLVSIPAITGILASNTYALTFWVR